MLTSSRFIVAIHALTVLARNAGERPVCSSTIAKSVHTNPVVIRRLMAELDKAGLVHSFAGRSGGFALKRDAEHISLADIYSAVEDDSMFRMHKLDPLSECPVSCQLTQAIACHLSAAENAMTSTLGQTKLADIATSIH
jgi:Rrf2 family protein